MSALTHRSQCSSCGVGSQSAGGASLVVVGVGWSLSPSTVGADFTDLACTHDFPWAGRDCLCLHCRPRLTLSVAPSALASAVTIMASPTSSSLPFPLSKRCDGPACSSSSFLSSTSLNLNHGWSFNNSSFAFHMSANGGHRLFCFEIAGSTINLSTAMRSCGITKPCGRDSRAALTHNYKIMNVSSSFPLRMV